MKDKMKIMISAGGSGGHLFPAMQLANQLLHCSDQTEFFFAGHHLQKSPFFLHSLFSFHEVSSSPLRLNVFSFMKGVVKGILQAIRIIKKQKPHLIVSFGSYHTFPIVVAAKILKIPFVIFEANTTLGWSNRLLSRYAVKVFGQFALENCPRSQLLPILPWQKSDRKWEQKEARKQLGLQEDLFTFLVFGGSQGALFINDIFSKAALRLRENLHFQVIHLSGRDPHALKKIYADNHIIAHVEKFSEQMPLIYAAADMAICRGGAATMGELITYALPALIIPYPYAYRHQEKNARYFANRLRGGLYLDQKDITEEKLIGSIQAIRSQLMLHSSSLREHYTKSTVLKPFYQHIMNKENLYE
ncbi:MAG: UDP-N-acetylglucosamine--N-acetylmuramyl-(pentapeptide) pyrophosphoryl-undecaprenol N-acetylglucosamine transferase [Parachlamydiales bacterium]|nr:UDP-N-acetylglucosamine--N-acetylmuramyl-(pentapeptide) pyrophosphoryl-undecaprenol N-acetylglucosamine transferase [Parachlamydiales bacterium]